MSLQNLVLEVCVDSVQSASGWSYDTDKTESELELFDNVRLSISAAQGGADRLEVCRNLGIGEGTTP